MSALTIEPLSVDRLIPYARNPRTHTDAQVAQIAASMREFGWTNAVLVDEANSLIAGHGRLLRPASWAWPRCRRSGSPGSRRPRRRRW